MDDFAAFLAWERASRDVIDVKRVYVDMAGDLAAGVVLSQIVYWHLPDRYGNSKLDAEKEGHWWLIRERSQWWEECRVRPKQIDRILTQLVKKGLIFTKVFRTTTGDTVTHIRINHEGFLTALHAEIGVQGVIPAFLHGELRNSSTGNSGVPDRGIAIKTENTNPETSQKKSEETTPAIPTELDTEDFRKAWSEWKAERSDQRRKPYTHRGEKAALAQLAPFGPKVAIATIKISIANSWQGLFPEKVHLPGVLPPKPPLIDPPIKRARDIPAMHFGKEPTWEEVNGYGKS